LKTVNGETSPTRDGLGDMGMLASLKAMLRNSLWCAAQRRGSVWTRAAVVSLPVGCLRALLRQGDLWWQHRVDGVVLAKTILSPLVTLGVAVMSCAATWVERQRTSNRQT